MKRKLAVIALALAGLGAVPAMAQASPVGPNASFQAGNFSHWSESTGACKGLMPSSTAAWDTFAIPFTLTPEEGSVTVAAPPGGHGAVFYQSGPSWGIVHRTFRIPAKARRLSFKVWWFNQKSMAPLWTVGKSIGCPTAIGPQMIYADLLEPRAKAISLKKSDRVLKLWRPAATTGGWKTVSVSVRKLRGKRVEFRFGVQSTGTFLNAALTGLRVR